MSAITEVVVTQAHLDAAGAAGGCEFIGKYRPGMPIFEVSTEHLSWFAEHCPDEARRLSAQAGGVPIWALGYGNGSGEGYGHGYGDGSGEGDGYRDGDGPGSGGYGYGYGYGYGSWYGYGYGDGTST